MPRRLRCLLVLLALLSSPAGFAADYVIHITATGPYDAAMMQAAQQITQTPGFRQRYPPTRYLLVGTAYAWGSPGGCFVAAGFALADLQDKGPGKSGDFAYVDTHDMNCPNAYTLGVVPQAQRIATQIFMEP
ncbi:MAG: hypothetical protein C0434_04950 [Xanthomonadaceae bacterium]|nr:hypothetical protein [Xanthomonadaceae bacterium]